jgi:hypothetical protein
MRKIKSSAWDKKALKVRFVETLNFTGRGGGEKRSRVELSGILRGRECVKLN